jgi:nucleoside-diphosphate-sugar epimerase
VEEGYIKIKHKGRTSKELIFPRCPTSIYHASKVASMYITEYLTRMWNLKTSEAEQAVVFGAFTKEIDETKIYSRLDTDGCFGTVLNRFIIQSLLNIPLTIFGEGNHKRGFIALQDSVNAIMLSIENPPENGKLRVFNQLSEHRSMNELAEMVKNTAQNYGIDVRFNHIPSPRHEHTGDHFYNIISEILPKLGYKPSRTIEQEIDYIFDVIDLEYIQGLRDTIVKNVVF